MTGGPIALRLSPMLVATKPDSLRPWAVAARYLVAVGLGLGGACVVSVPDGEGKPGPCGGRACSVHGSCERGTDRCRCDSGFSGNPYASFGCQPTRTKAKCSASCGLNAHCDDDGCACDEGFVAVCGTGDCLAESALCDGEASCANGADEQPDICFETVVMQWSVVDDCDDDEPVHWRLWAAERDWVWPSADSEFATASLSQPSIEGIECLAGELVCFGGTAGDNDWGVGASGVGACDACCEPCREETIEYGVLSCE